MNPMDKEYIEKHDVCQRYRTGTLTPEETEAFEVYLLEHPDMLEQLELDTLLADGLRKVATQPPTKKSRNRPFWWGVFGAAGGGVLAFAATIFLTFPYNNNLSGSSQILYLETVRGEPQSNLVSLGEERTLVLVMDTGVNARTEFDVEVKNSNGKTMNAWQGLKSDADGQAVILLETEDLDTDILNVTIQPLQGNTASFTYQIQMIKSK